MLKALQQRDFQDWCEPDWLKPKTYDYTEGFTYDQWAWEFLRRNPVYRKEWDGWVRNDAAASKATNDPQGEAARIVLAAAKWHLISPCDPSLPVSTELPIWRREARQWEPFMLGDLGPDKFGRPFKRIRKDRALSQYADFGPHVQAFALSLNHPIPAQLDLVREQIVEYQKEHGLDTEVTARSRKEIWGLYLRALDGKDSGAKLIDVGRALWPDDVAGRENLKDKASKTIKRAKELGDRGDGGYVQQIIALGQRTA